jgi:hypothetical protein
MIRRMFAAIALASTLLIPATHAFAAPTGAPTAMTIPLSCDNGQTYTVVVNSGNSGQNEQATAFGPGFIAGGGMLLPLSFTFTGTDTTTGDVLFSQTSTKGEASHAPGTVLNCTGTLGTMTLENGDTAELSLTVTALLR